MKKDILMQTAGKQWAAFTLLTLFGFPFLVAAQSWKVEKLAYDLDTAEGPVWDSEGKLYFTEIFANEVHEYTVASGEFLVIRRESGGSNGMAFDSHGRLLMCEMAGKRVTRLEEDGSVSTLWKAGAPGKGGPNDIVVSSLGNIYFTMPKHRCVYRIATDGVVTPFINDVPGINGVMLSRDETTLYVTEYKQRKVQAYPLDEKPGTVGPGRLFAEIETTGTEHGADGMTIDDQDRLYVCCLNGVWIFDAGGDQVGFIALPGERVTNCAFGETEDELFITTQKGLFRASLLEGK